MLFPLSSWAQEKLDALIDGLHQDAHEGSFDEILLNEKLGHCRGTGVVQLINGEWKIAHYALTMLIPNVIAAEVGSKTREVDKQQ